MISLFFKTHLEIPDESPVLSNSHRHLKGLIPVSLPLLKFFLEMCLESDT